MSKKRSGSVQAHKPRDLDVYNGAEAKRRLELLRQGQVFRRVKDQHRPSPSKVEKHTLGMINDWVEESMRTFVSGNAYGSGLLFEALLRLLCFAFPRTANRNRFPIEHFLAQIPRPPPPHLLMWDQRHPDLWIFSRSRGYFQWSTFFAKAYWMRLNTNSPGEMRSMEQEIKSLESSDEFLTDQEMEWVAMSLRRDALWHLLPSTQASDEPPCLDGVLRLVAAKHPRIKSELAAFPKETPLRFATCRR